MDSRFRGNDGSEAGMTSYAKVSLRGNGDFGKGLLRG